MSSFITFLYLTDMCLKRGVTSYALGDGNCRTYMKCNELGNVCLVLLVFELGHSSSYKMACAPSKD